MTNRCSIMLTKLSRKLDATLQMKDVMTSMPSIATSTIFITDNLPKIIPPIATPSPVIVISTKSPLVQYRCSMSGMLTTVTWSQMTESSHSVACPLSGADFKVTYNNLLPFFWISNSGVLRPPNTFLEGTLEGEYLRTFIIKHNLNVSFKNAKGKWGSLNKTTNKWNGMVGLVSIDKW